MLLFPKSGRGWSVCSELWCSQGAWWSEPLTDNTKNSGRKIVNRNLCYVDVFAWKETNPRSVSSVLGPSASHYVRMAELYKVAMPDSRYGSFMTRACLDLKTVDDEVVDHPQCIERDWSVSCGWPRLGWKDTWEWSSIPLRKNGGTTVDLSINLSNSEGSRLYFCFDGTVR